MKSKVIFSEIKGMSLKDKYKTARKYIRQGDLKSADTMLDLCIVHLSKETLNGKTEIDGVDINLWKTRVWTAVEVAGLLPE
jgi:hypothetical protein